MLRGGHGDPDRTFYWEHEDNRGVRMGKWMLCTLGGPEHPFELYDVETDRIQSTNVAAEHTDVVRQMEQMYADWAKRAGVIPWQELKAGRAGRKPTTTVGRLDDD
jgi:arylsulfatase A-like enzyme